MSRKPQKFTKNQFSATEKRGEKTNASAISNQSFATLAKVVKYMHARHLKGDFHPLTVDEILEECNLLDSVDSSVKRWLAREALPGNSKIRVTSDGKSFTYKPMYDLKDGKSLMRLLKHHDIAGLGGIMQEDVEESLPNCQKFIEKHASQIVVLERPGDKKKILFYHEKRDDMKIDNEFKEMFNAIDVSTTTEREIEEYLEQRGLTVMKSEAVNPEEEKKPKRGRKRNVSDWLRTNDHLGKNANNLKTYE